MRIAERAFLGQFASQWKYYHSLEPEQLAYADRATKVLNVGFYHGGDPLYTLENVPGTWHECCLRSA